MASTTDQPARTRTAIVVSIVLHLCVLGALARLAREAPAGTAPLDDNGPTFPITTVVRRSPAPARSPVLGPAIRPIAHHAAVPRLTAVLPRRSVPRAQVPAIIPTGPVARESRHSAPAPHVLALNDPAASAYPALRGLDPVPTPTPAPTPTQTPIPTPTPTATPAATPKRNFGGLFSQNYPPALSSPAILTTIRSRLGGHGHVRIDIDEAGHATAIHFEPMQVDDATVADLRGQLLGLTYVPADCNGLPCDGSLDLTY